MADEDESDAGGQADEEAESEASVEMSGELIVAVAAAGKQGENRGCDGDAEDAQWELVERLRVTQDRVACFIERHGMAEHCCADPDGPHRDERVEHGVELQRAET